MCVYHNFCQQTEYLNLMKNSGLFLLLMWFIFLYSGCGTKEDTQPDKPAYELSSSAKIPAFDASQAFKNIEKFASFGPRVPNTKEHEAAKNYIISTCTPLADSLAKQEFQLNGYDGEKLQLTNIIVSFNPRQTKRILICTHWDSRPWADAEKDKAKHNTPILGVNDGGSGVWILLELARILHDNKTTLGVDLVFFDGEDYGKHSELNNFCLGSKYFAASKNDYSPAFGILLDLVGDKEAKFYKEENSVQAAEQVVDLFWESAAKAGAHSFVNEKKYGIYDDHTPLNNAGLRTIDIIDAQLVGADESLGRRAYWHTLHDTMDNIGEETISDVGKTVTNFIYSLVIN